MVESPRTKTVTRTREWGDYALEEDAYTNGFDVEENEGYAVVR